jgi:hypothetical protein
MRPIPGQHGDTLHAPKNVSDITDSPRDQERLQHEETTIDLPDVEDIPGQENVTVQPLGELADTTISSADEEGTGVLDKDEPNDSDVTPEEVEDLRRSAEVYPTQDEEILQRSGLDGVDMEGDPLNEGSFTGDINMAPDDLDIPDEDADDPDTEALGQGDEENSYYSMDEDEEQAETT